MSLRKSRTFLALALLTTLISFAPIQKVAAAASTPKYKLPYQQCVAELSRPDMAPYLPPVVNKAVTLYVGSMQQYPATSDKFTLDADKKISNGITDDIGVLEQMKVDVEDKSKQNKPQMIKDLCRSWHIFAFRTSQVSYMKYINANYKRDNTLYKALTNHASRTFYPVNSPLKADIAQRVKIANVLLEQSIGIEKAAADKILNASLDENYVTTLTKPDALTNTNGLPIKANYNAASYNRHVAMAIKQAGTSLSSKTKASVQTAELYDANGTKITEGGKNATKAVVTVNVEGKSSPQTNKITLKRKSAAEPWKVDRTTYTATGESKQ